MTRPDRDELVFGNADPLTVTFEGGASILVGGSARRLPAGTVTVGIDETDAPAINAPMCPPEPTLLLWHAGSADVATPADPDLERRLRAIGYLPLGQRGPDRVLGVAKQREEMFSNYGAHDALSRTTARGPDRLRRAR